MTLGKMFKKARVEQHLTMDELADKLNKKYNLKINKGMISKWEKDGAIPSLVFVQVYAKESGLMILR